MEEKPKTESQAQEEERDEFDDLDLPEQIAEDARGGKRKRATPDQIHLK